MRWTLRAVGPASATAVWERYAELAQWSSWSPQIRHVTPTERIHAGMHGRIDGVLPFAVTAVDEQARRWSWVVGRWPVRVRLKHTVEDTKAGSMTTLTLDGPAALVLPYLPLAQLALRQLVRDR